MKTKTKKIIGYSSIGLVVVATLSITLPIVLTSCSSSSSSIENPSLHSTSFTTMNKDDLSPIALGSLSSTEGRNSLVKTFVNKLLLSWYSTISNSTLTAQYNNWVDDAEKSYNDSYNDYKDNKGSNWKELFQKDVLDPVGGTRQDYIENQIYSKIKDQFIQTIFNKDYLVVKNNDQNIKVITSTKKMVTDPTNINGANGAGTKNNFSFSEDAIEKNSRTSLDYGIANFLDFLMDDWVYNEFPLPISMSLWKSAANPDTSGLFNKDFFGSALGADGSYNFQWFSPITKDPTDLPSTERFRNLMNDLINGRYVNSETGLIDLPKNYTEDSSTSMTIEFDKLFSGDFSIPFSASALYKLNNTIFGITDSNVPTIDSSSLVTDSIMKNFLVFDQSQVGSNGVFGFPYNLDNNGPAFLGDYSGAVGVKDNLNFTDSTGIGNFVLNRNSFGVHLIGIDRLSKMKEAVGSASQGTISLETYQKLCNEIRNTFMYRYATFVCPINENTNSYDLKSTLKTYLTDNFETIIFKYVTNFIKSNDFSVNNLFGASVVNNTAYLNNSNSNYSSKQTSGFGFDKNTKQEYIDILNSVNNTELYNLIYSSLLLIKAESVLDTSNNLKNKIYSNSSSYSEYKNPDIWKSYGIAGVMPYTRNQTTGDFDFLDSIIKSLISNAISNNSNIKTFNSKAYNSKSNYTITSNSQQITQINNSDDFVTFAKNLYESSIANYINSVNLHVNNTKTYIATPVIVFTNNDYINNAIQANDNASNLDTIAQNFYMQNYLTSQAGFELNSKKRAINSQFYDFSTNTLSFQTGQTEGSSGWVKEQLQNSINQMYILNNFTSLPNLYFDGNWSTIDNINTIANTIWQNSWNSSQYNFSSNTNSNIVCYENPRSVSDYYKFLITIEYLLNYDANTDTFTFKNLVQFLNDATENNGKAVVAWINQSSITDNPSFGLNDESPEIASIADIQTNIQTSSSFNGEPFLLTKVNPYSWYGAPNYFNGTVTDLQYSEDSNYWYTSPVLSTSDELSAGFVGFQFNRASSLGLSNIGDILFENKTYTNSPVDSDVISYLGSLYEFGSRENIIKYVQTKLSVVSSLENFYNNYILEPGLPITQATMDKIDDILNSQSNNTDKVKNLVNALTTLLNDPTQIPDNCFTKVNGLPIWNDNGTTLFDSNSDGLKNQYIVTQFNYQDVQNAFIQKQGDSNSGTIYKLNTDQNGYLGLNPITFFNCIVKLAMDSSILKEEAYNNMFLKIGDVAVYDYRLIDFIDSEYISNYNEWDNIINLS